MENIEAYNADCAAGVDSAFHKYPELMIPVSKAPFYGAVSDTSFFLTILGGLRTDENMRVRDEDDNPIEGLYNVGSMAGDMFSDAQYTYMIPGFTYGSNLTLSYLTGQVHSGKRVVAALGRAPGRRRVGGRVGTRRGAPEDAGARGVGSCAPRCAVPDAPDRVEVRRGVGLPHSGCRERGLRQAGPFRVLKCAGARRAGCVGLRVAAGGACKTAEAAQPSVSQAPPAASCLRGASLRRAGAVQRALLRVRARVV